MTNPRGKKFRKMSNEQAYALGVINTKKKLGKVLKEEWKKSGQKSSLLRIEEKMRLREDRDFDDQ